MAVRVNVGNSEKNKIPSISLGMVATIAGTTTDAFVTAIGDNYIMVTPRYKFRKFASAGTGKYASRSTGVLNQNETVTFT
jgi:hypothetical protein